MANHRHKKIVKMAKGYRGRTNCFRIAVQRVEKALQYAYRDRKVRWRGVVIDFVVVGVDLMRRSLTHISPRTHAFSSSHTGEEARVPLPLDPAHLSGRAAVRDELLEVRVLVLELGFAGSGIYISPTYTPYHHISMPT